MKRAIEYKIGMLKRGGYDYCKVYLFKNSLDLLSMARELVFSHEDIDLFLYIDSPIMYKDPIRGWDNAHIRDENIRWFNTTKTANVEDLSVEELRVCLDSYNLPF